MSSSGGRKDERLVRREQQEAERQRADQKQRRRAPSVEFYSTSLKRVFELRRLIYHEAFHGFEEFEFGIEDIPALGQRLDKLIKDVPASVWFETLRSLVGVTLTDAFLRDYSWTLAGNLRLLKKGRPVRAWRKQRSDEWCPVQITNVRKATNRKGEPGAWVTFCVLAGAPAGQMFDKFWTRKQCKFYAQALGFSSPYNKGKKAVRFADVRQLTLMRLYVFFSTEHCADRLTFFHLRVTASFKGFNHKLLAKRKRQGFKCPKGFHHPCHHCAIGYDKCPVATHPKTFIKRKCFRCEKMSVFDPADAESGVCIQCSSQ